MVGGRSGVAALGRPILSRTEREYLSALAAELVPGFSRAAPRSPNGALTGQPGSDLCDSRDQTPIYHVGRSVWKAWRAYPMGLLGLTTITPDPSVPRDRLCFQEPRSSRIGAQSLGRVAFNDFNSG